MPKSSTWSSKASALYHWGFDLPPEDFSKLKPGSFHGVPWFRFDGKELRRDQCTGTRPTRPFGEVESPAVTFPPEMRPWPSPLCPMSPCISPATRG